MLKAKAEDLIDRTSAQKLGTHISWTYFTLRNVLYLLAVIFPISLWAWSSWEFDTLTPGTSISGYYHAKLRFIHDHFVGTLTAVGICLIAYRGFTKWENWLLNLAGASVIGVAMFPTTVNQAPRFTLDPTLERASESAGLTFGSEGSVSDSAQRRSSPGITPRGMCALVFFACLAAVALTQSRQSLRLIDDETTRRYFSGLYKILG